MAVVIKALQEHTTAGLDGFRTSDMKCIWNSYPSFLVTLFNNCLKWGSSPSVWRKGRILLLHKAGKPRNETKSYRPIGISSILGKILERLVL